MLVTEYTTMSPNSSTQDTRKDTIAPDDAGSTKSHDISIESIDDDASSIASDSSEEYQEMAEKPELGERGRSYAMGAMNQVNRIGANGLLVIDDQQQLQKAPDRPPTIETVAVSNSSDITFGNKTFINGPVTIKQFIKEGEPRQPQGQDNPGYEGSSRSINVDNTTQFEYKKKFLEYRTWILVGVTFIFALIGLISLIIFFTTAGEMSKAGDGDDYRKNIPIQSTIGNTTLRLVSRSEWIAQPPSEELVNLSLPAHRVIIAHTATEDCETQASCVYRVRFIQTFHLESRGWDDIGYNFLVGGDGSAYEGRGWDKVGAHTKGFNVDSICIAFIGTFVKVTPPERQLLAAKKLIEWGVQLGKLSKDYRLYGHRQLIPSESPGAALYAIIKTWPHYSTDPS
ncbi:peptidoglycan-recognition protein LC-like isoform X2 [Lutzomyia longipalpis]|uniref:peptidoglycan-recognition protein LC-like isoform X2 n=1 Tax=Lutzomyia longipalpis TaxID=7200 RepID=UPI0024842136|nr:peptidoglycan-recognition protein LC-like isoform X2 [Lutzomyia longipalpis]